MASLLYRRRSTEVNQTSHDVCAGILYILFGGSGSYFARCKIHFASKSPVLVALMHCTRAVYVSQSLRRGRNKEGNYETFAPRLRHLYSAGRPSLWASAHILVKLGFLWSPYGIGQTIIFSCCGFFYLFFLSFFPRLISAVADWMSTILPHMVWP